MAHARLAGAFPAGRAERPAALTASAHTRLFAAAAAVRARLSCGAGAGDAFHAMLRELSLKQRRFKASSVTFWT